MLALGALMAHPAQAAPATPAELAAALARHDSATLALEEWCAARGIATPARVLAEPVFGGTPEEPIDLRDLLGVPAGAKLGYRHVRLACGGVVLSDAQNWYVPARLTLDMADTLANTDAPFGKVVAPLHFTRTRLASAENRLPGCPDDTVLAQRALLRLPDGSALALVVECYTAAALGGAGKGK